MRTINKRVLCALAATLLVSAVGATSVFAAGTSDVKVTYTHSNTTPGDPDNPDGVTWAISIPMDVNLSKTHTTTDMSVSIEGYNGVATADIDGTITVKVKSNNTDTDQWNLVNKQAAPATKLPYTLSYKSSSIPTPPPTDITNQALNTTGFTLNGANPTIAGTLTLKPLTGDVPKADYSDTLTYTYTKDPVDSRPTT